MYAQPKSYRRFDKTGGFVIGSNASYDTYLTRLSNELGLTVASVEYRLAPEHPYPDGYHDAVDAALFALSEDGVNKLGAPLRVLGGESAGGWYAVAVALALRDKHGVDVQSQLSAICAGYGIFDLTYTPSCLDHKRNIVLSSDGMQRFVEAGFAHIPLSDRKTPEISPLYADLRNLPQHSFWWEISSHCSTTAFSWPPNGPTLAMKRICTS